ncbi:MAG TPA: DUF1566 domain-containing protein [Gammaproteobacteria bacterium]|nr:DUF1566 domain-containing protein [Gammaproteobacteria bacterium]
MKKILGILVLVTSSAFLTAYAAISGSNTKADNLYVGAYHQGGVIYWLDPEKQYQHGLIVDINDAPSASGYAWDTTPPGKTGAIGDKPYAGKANTQTIIATIGSKRAQAASICANSHNQGYSDWYLPAKKELALMLGQGRMTAKIIETAKAHGGEDFNQSPYWSSTEYAFNSAWNVSGGRRDYGATYKKNTLLRVRCIRAF